MPTIYDNINPNTTLLDGLKEALKVARRADFCVGYFNLRGWQSIAAEIEAIPPQPDMPACRLIVGKSVDDAQTIRNYYNHVKTETTNKIVHERQKQFAESLMRQLASGIPTASDETGLNRLARQLESGRLQVKFFGAHPLHAKLYLAHRDDTINPIIGYVGSSNLTLSGLEQQGELNVDVLDTDAAAKLANWFEERWEDPWCLDVTADLAAIIKNSWAGGPISPYEIYIKTAYELSREAIEGSREFKVPKIFDKKMLDFQKQAVSLAAERLNRRGGVIIGDVVGLGKTLVASAVAKTFQVDRGDSVLVICPPKLERMWKEYLHEYGIAGDTLSLGKVHSLQEMRRFRLVVIDESHNLRNRDAKRYGHVHDYVRNNDSRVVLLTATPYNKDITDISNQLRLFVEADADLGARPDEYINFLGGVDKFKEHHPNDLPTSLAAFEHSLRLDDWRELMRMFMVRRTRSHIKRNYADYDEDQRRHYLSFDDGKRFYFPHRKPKCAKFSLDTNTRDQYARLYSTRVVDIIGKLTLPRYGLGRYLLPDYQPGASPDGVNDATLRIIQNLSRAGSRLIGFAKAGLFKRLESSGQAFLLSIRRHIVRNAVYLSALDCNGEFPIGDILHSLADETEEEDATDPLAQDHGKGDGLEHFLEKGKQVYTALSDPCGEYRKKFEWIETRCFDPSLKDALLEDCRVLLDVLAEVPEWDAAADRKLDALDRLCRTTHKEDKLLIFTQFKDTADYLYRELTRRGVARLAEVFGGMDDISGHVKRFSPVSNNAKPGADQLRVLITTDTLSEGQNLQDAHIVVNFDLPWAIIRLVQRAGRVDRIGQKSPEILCYSFLPEEGIEDIIGLRGRLQRRIGESADLLGSDEKFFEGDTVNLKQVYEETINLEDEEDETDLISRAYDIWRQATRKDPGLKEKIAQLPDMVYSSKRKRARDTPGVLAYVKTNTNQHILTQLSVSGEVITQSQSKILNLLECDPTEPPASTAGNHHKLVEQVVAQVKEGHVDIGGQLGGAQNIRCRVYKKLQSFRRSSDTLKRAIDQIYCYPLKETARDRLRRQLHANIGDDDLAALVEILHDAGDLCAVPRAGEPVVPHVICSMGLVESTEST